MFRSKSLSRIPRLLLNNSSRKENQTKVCNKIGKGCNVHNVLFSTNSSYPTHKFVRKIQSDHIIHRKSDINNDSSNPLKKMYKWLRGKCLAFNSTKLNEANDIATHNQSIYNYEYVDNRKLKHTPAGSCTCKQTNTVTKNVHPSKPGVNDTVVDAVSIGNGTDRSSITARFFVHKTFDGTKDNAIISGINKGLLVAPLSDYLITRQKQLTHSAAFNSIDALLPNAWIRGKDYTPDKKIVYQLEKSNEGTSNSGKCNMSNVATYSTQCEILHQDTLKTDDEIKNAVAWDFNQSYKNHIASKISENQNAVAWDSNKVYKSDNNQLLFNIRGDVVFKPFQKSLNMSNEQKESNFAKPWVRLADNVESYPTLNQSLDKSPLESLLSVYTNCKKEKTQFINTTEKEIRSDKQSINESSILDTITKNNSTNESLNHNINVDQNAVLPSSTLVEESKMDTCLKVCSNNSETKDNKTITEVETKYSEHYSDKVLIDIPDDINNYSVSINNPSDKYIFEANQQLDKETPNSVGVIDAHVQTYSSSKEEIKGSTDSVIKAETLYDLNNKSYSPILSNNLELFNRTYSDCVLGEEREIKASKDVDGVATPSDAELSEMTIKNLDVFSPEKETTKTSSKSPPKQTPTLKILEDKIIIVGKHAHSPTINKQHVTNYYQERITSMRNKIETMKADFLKDVITKSKQTTINENSLSTSTNQNAIKDTTPLTPISPIMNQETKKVSESLNIILDNMKTKSVNKSDLSSQRVSQNDKVLSDSTQSEHQKTHNERMAELYEYEEKVLGIHPPNSNPFESQEKLNTTVFTTFLDAVGPNEMKELTNSLSSVPMDSKPNSNNLNTNLPNSKELVTDLQTEVSNIKNTRQSKQIENIKNTDLKTSKEKLMESGDKIVFHNNLNASEERNVNKEPTNLSTADKKMNTRPITSAKIDSQSDSSPDKMQYYNVPKSDVAKPQKNIKPVEEVSVKEFMKIMQKELTSNRLLRVDGSFDMKEEIQKYLPYKISKAMLQSLFSTIFSEDTRTQNIEKNTSRFVSDEDQVQVEGQFNLSEQEMDETEDSESDSKSNLYSISYILMKLNAQRFPMINDKKSELTYSKAEELIINSDFSNIRCRHIPSVSKILDDTLPKKTERALRKWETINFNKLGILESRKLYQQQLMNDVQFHDCVRRHIMGTPMQLLTENATNETRGCMESLRSVFSRLQDVTVLESSAVHSLLPYHGIVDCVGTYRGNPVVIEWKQAHSPKSIADLTIEAPIKLAAYIGAINHDAHYKFPITSGMIVFAYTDGSPADVMQFSSTQTEFFWKLWLKRLKKYLETKYSNPK